MTQAQLAGSCSRASCTNRVVTAANSALIMRNQIAMALSPIPTGTQSRHKEQSRRAFTVSPWPWKLWHKRAREACAATGRAGVAYGDACKPMESTELIGSCRRQMRKSDSSRGSSGFTGFILGAADHLRSTLSVCPGQPGPGLVL